MAKSKKTESLDETASRIEEMLDDTADPDKELIKEAEAQADDLENAAPEDEDEIEDDEDSDWDDEDDSEDDEDEEDEVQLTKTLAANKVKRGKPAAQASAIGKGKSNAPAIPTDNNEDDEDDFDDDDEDGDDDDIRPASRKAPGKSSAVGKYTGTARAKPADNNEDGQTDNQDYAWSKANKRMGKSFDAGEQFLMELASDVESATILDQNPVLRSFAAQIGEMTAMLQKSVGQASRLAKSIATPVSDGLMDTRIARLEKSVQTQLRVSQRLLEMGMEAEERPHRREIVTIPPTYAVTQDPSDPNLRKTLREDQRDAARMQEMIQIQSRFGDVQRHDPSYGARYLWAVQQNPDRTILRKNLPDGNYKSYILGDTASIDE